MFLLRGVEFFRRSWFCYNRPFFCYKSPANSSANSPARSSVFSYFMFFCYMQQKSRLCFATVAKSGFRGAILGLKILLHIAKIGTFSCYRSKSGNWELVWGHVARGGAGRWELPIVRGTPSTSHIFFFFQNKRSPDRIVGDLDALEGQPSLDRLKQDYSLASTEPGTCPSRPLWWRRGSLPLLLL